MIDQDYAELLSRTPPSGEVLEWTFPTRLLAAAFSALLLGTPAVCTVLYGSGVAGVSDPREGGAELRIPTLTRLGEQHPIQDIFTAGLHLAAFMALPLFWCIRLAHHQRLQARTGIARYDIEADEARRWIEFAWGLGSLGAVSLFLGGSLPGDKNATFSTQGIAHLVVFVVTGVGMVGQATCTVCAIRKARRVFLVSDADLVSYRRKKWLSVAMIVAGAAALASVLLLERFVDRAWGISDTAGNRYRTNSNQNGSHLEVSRFAALAVRDEDQRSRNCDKEWCYSRSALGLWEWVFLLLEAGFCIALRHDLSLATGGVGVEGFVL